MLFLRMYSIYKRSICMRKTCAYKQAFTLIQINNTFLLKISIKPALLRQATYRTVTIGFYQYLKKKVLQNPKGMEETV